MDFVSENASFKRRRNTLELKNNNVLPNFLITAASTQGGRRYMEDRLQIEVKRSADGQLDFVYAAVYDGHGGTQASEYVRQHLFKNIVNSPSFSSDDDHLVLGAIRAAFLKTHSDMREAAMHWPPTVSGFPCTAGTTATCALIRNGKLFTGHVGDSSIVLANFAETDAGYKDAKLTDDHKPEMTTERQRIERAGGAVALKSGIFRVIWKRPMRGHRGPVRRSTATENIPFLAVARSLGDFWSFNPISNEYTVSPEPDVDVFELKDSDNFLVIATDGLTTVVGIRTIIEALRETERRSHKFNNNYDVSSLNGNDNYVGLIDFDEIDTDLPMNHAHYLLQYTFKRWSTLRADNISIICIKLNAYETPTAQSVIVDDPSLKVCDAMTDHPMAMLRVTDKGTQLLRTNTIRHRYFGTTDKCVVAAVEQQNGKDSFSGPGFVRPDQFGDMENNNKNTDAIKIDNQKIINRTSLNICASERIVAELVDVVATTMNTTTTPVAAAVMTCGSDVEEVKPSEAELALSTTSSFLSDNEPGQRPQQLHAANGDSCRPKSRTLQNLDSVKALVNTDSSSTKWKVKPKWKEATPATAKLLSSPTAPRHSLKRRLRDDDEEDERSTNNLGIYGRHLHQQHNKVPRSHFDECASTTTTSTHVSLEDDNSDFGTVTTATTTAATKPPPAKRSRIQNVVSFFTSLFGFRWPG